MIVCHIETSAGARFSTHENEEELRQELIEYNNETLNSGEPDDQLPDDATLEEAIEKIEESENVSWEEIYTPTAPKLYLICYTNADGENLDAIVEASEPARAQQLWAEEWEMDVTDPAQAPQKIFEINPTGQEGILGWNSNQLKRII